MELAGVIPVLWPQIWVRFQSGTNICRETRPPNNPKDTSVSTCLAGVLLPVALLIPLMFHLILGQVLKLYGLEVARL